MAVDPPNLVDKQNKETNIVPISSSPIGRDILVLVCWLGKAEEEGYYDTEGDISPFLHTQLADGSQDFVEASLLTEVHK